MRSNKNKIFREISLKKNRQREEHNQTILHKKKVNLLLKGDKKGRYPSKRRGREDGRKNHLFHKMNRFNDVGDGQWRSQGTGRHNLHLFRHESLRSSYYFSAIPNAWLQCLLNSRSLAPSLSLALSLRYFYPTFVYPEKFFILPHVVGRIF